LDQGTKKLRLNYINRVMLPRRMIWCLPMGLSKSALL